MSGYTVEHTEHVWAWAEHAATELVRLTREARQAADARLSQEAAHGSAVSAEAYALLDAADEAQERLDGYLPPVTGKLFPGIEDY